MEELKQFSGSCSKNGTFERRFSPRLHNATPFSHPIESSPKPTQSPNILSNFRRRFSPRLHRDLAKLEITHSEKIQSPTIPSPHPNSRSRFSPRLHGGHATPEIADSEKNQSPHILPRRFSPRLHGDHAKQEIADSDKVQSPNILSRDPDFRRRFSPRLHKDDKIVGSEETSQKSKVSPNSNGCTSEKRSRSDSHTNTSFSNAKRSKLGDNGCESKLKPSHFNGNDELPSSEVNVDVPILPGRSIHARVKKTLRIFNSYHLQFVQEEEESNGKEKKSKVVKSKDNNVKHSASRPVLKAISKMKEKHEILYPDKRIGNVPGIEVGYQFLSRAEMVVIGFHSQWMGGIDYMDKMNKHGQEGKQNTLPIAIAVVWSAQYEDDLDNSDDIVFTGHDLVGSKLESADQVLLRDDLAMKNSMAQSVPVRVIRGYRSADSYSGNIYTYHGLYKVVMTSAEKGQIGSLVYKYHLKRIEGQPKVTTNQFQFLFVGGCPSKTFFELPGLVCSDISKGQEAIWIPVTNLYDDASVDEGFTYMTTTEVAESVELPPSTCGCACKGNCTDPQTCSCAKLNGSDFPYVHRNGGRLVEAKDVVFECGPNCSCGPRCLNRTSQRGIKYHLEVYRTPDKGWAVRSWDFIPSGAPVCEYIGIVRRNDDVDNICGNDFIFEIDCWHTMNEVEGRERRFGNVAATATRVCPRIDDKTLDNEPEFCIDAGSRGNVARFINHSCEPNLFVQCILSTHHDLRLARLVLFAADDIPPMQELTYDYGYALDSVTGPDGKVKVLPCFCGTTDCRKRLY